MLASKRNVEASSLAKFINLFRHQNLKEKEIRSIIIKGSPKHSCDGNSSTCKTQRSLIYANELFLVLLRYGFKPRMLRKNVERRDQCRKKRETMATRVFSFPLFPLFLKRSNNNSLI